jgi:hypothetical protein
VGEFLAGLSFFLSLRACSQVQTSYRFFIFILGNDMILTAFLIQVGVVVLQDYVFSWVRTFTEYRYYPFT